MRIARKDIYTKASALPTLKFEDQELTSYAGLVVFQNLFDQLELKQNLLKCFDHVRGKCLYHPGTIIQVVVLHVLLGFRKFRDTDFYKDDPLIKRVLGLKVLPDVATISRQLARCDQSSVDELQELNRQEIARRLVEEGFNRITLDFDGSVLSTKSHAEGSAVGFNRRHKGHRSYYPLFCMIAQTGQVFDVLHRSGDVHDSNGAIDFIIECILFLREQMPAVQIEVRMDGAFFSDCMVHVLEQLGVEFTISVPFERFAKLKRKIQQRKFWWSVRKEQAMAFFQEQWKPKKWEKRYRFLFIRKEVGIQRKGPWQLDLFDPQDWRYDYKVIVTNKKGVANTIVRFHEGRGQQENVFSELKTQGQLDYLPGKHWVTNKLYLLCNVLAHNLARELQMQSRGQDRNRTLKRSPQWIFEGLESLRRIFIQRAGRLIRPQGILTLSLSANAKVQGKILEYLAMES